jgi:site-specific DNA recombinase
MPELRSRETSLRSQLDALTTQLVDREAYLNLATSLEGFLARLRTNAAAATIPEQQRVLRLLVKDVLVGPQRILIRHSIPTGGTTATITDGDADEEPSPSSPLRWRSHLAPARERLPAPAGPAMGTTAPRAGAAHPLRGRSSDRLPV